MSQFNRIPAIQISIHMATELERRAALRYQLQAPVIFKFIGDNQLMMQGAGFVKNISTAGVFVWTRTVPPHDQDLEVEILIPRLDKLNFALRSVGRAVRTEAGIGFALAGDFSFNRMP